jgi:hypothetical protein
MCSKLNLFNPLHWLRGIYIYIYIYGQYFFAMWHTFKDLYLIICGRPNLINFLSVFFLLFWYIDNIQIKPSPVGEHSI